ncbi:MULTISPECIES: CgeB family protein [Cohnella]|uniref:CgeB family protein n=1 Tax=Cohnella TaxID=329857 RepID=UPI00308426C4
MAVIRNRAKIGGKVRTGQKSGTASAYAAGQRSGLALGFAHGRWQGLCEAVIQKSAGALPRRAATVLFVTSGKGFPYSPLDEAVQLSLLGLAERVIVASPKDDVAGLAAAERPDLVLVLEGMEFPPEQVASIRLNGIRTAIWFTDDPYYTDITSGLAPCYDYVFTLENNCVPYYQQLGCPRVHYLPLGVFPEYFRPRNPQLSLRGDVCFIGSAYWNRVDFFSRLLPYIEHRSFHLSGIWWDRLPEYKRWKDRIQLDRWMTPLETAEHYNAFSIVINVHRSHDDETFNRNGAKIVAQSPNPRVFEISACGTLQIVDQRSDLPLYYKPGEEIVTYDTPEDLAAKVEYYLNHEEERQLLALRALRRTMRDHTYANRLHQLLEIALAP